MVSTLTCPHCGQTSRTKADLSGKTVRCRQCGESFRAPQPEETEAPSPGRQSLESHSKPLSDFFLETVAEKPSPLPPRRGAEAEPKSKPASPNASKRKAASTPKSGNRTRPIFAFLATVLVVLGGIGRISKLFRSPQSRTEARAAAPVQPTGRVLASGVIQVPTLPNVGPGREIEPGVTFHEMQLPGEPIPGGSGKLWLYLPSGEHAPRSLPCVMITGAGSNLLTGMHLGDGDRPEHLPYVHEGFAVLAYEMDGGLTQEHPSSVQFEQAAQKFLAARAGLVNAHIALEFLRAKVPQVDPERIFAAGHSSAGTAALVFAENERRLKGCVAFAPATDLEKRLAPAMSQIDAMGWTDLAIRYSPKNSAQTLACPLFLFHAQDDGNIPVQDSEAFAVKLRQMGKTVELDLVPDGGHYDSMIDPGIPHAIAWLKRLAGMDAQSEVAPGVATQPRN